MVAWLLLRITRVGKQYGGSYIIDPRGEILAKAAIGETTILAKGSLEHVLAAKAASDAGDHYSRPDQLQLLVNNRPLEQLVRGTAEEADESGSETDEST